MKKTVKIGASEHINLRAVVRGQGQIRQILST